MRDTLKDLVYKSPYRSASKKLVPVNKLVSRLDKVKSYEYAPTVETDVVMFYALNEIVSKLFSSYGDDTSLDRNDRASVLTYLDEHIAIFRRILLYLIVICTRESRHAKWSGKVEAEVGKSINGSADIIKFLRYKVKGGGSSFVQNLVMDRKLPDVDALTYAKCLAVVFRTASFSSYYGGPKWAKICDALVDYLSGTTNAETTVDRAFNLQHNTGPIFNKGFLYKAHSPTLNKLLDLQHRGCILNLVSHLCEKGESAHSGIANPCDTRAIVKTLGPIIERMGISLPFSWNMTKAKKDIPTGLLNAGLTKADSIMIDAFLSVSKITRKELTT